MHEKVEDKIGATSLEKGEEVTEKAKRNLEKVGASSPRRQEHNSTLIRPLEELLH